MKNCPNCLIDFEPNSGKQKFCSDKCKVAFARKSANKIKGVTTADKIKSFSNGGTILDQISIDNKKAAWIKQIEDFCSQEGILPEDLIVVYKEKRTTKKKEEMATPKKDEVSVSHFMSDLRKRKCGL